MGLSNSPRERAELLVGGILHDLHHAIRRVVNIYNNGNEVVDGVIMPEAMKAIEAAGLAYDDGSEKKADAPRIVVYTGERRDLCHFVNLPFCGVSWDRAIDIIASCCRKNKADNFIKPGDYIDIPVNVESVEIMGCEFDEIRIEADARMVATAVFPDKVIFNFEDVIGYAPMNSDDTNAGGFAATALAKYLNTAFFESVFKKVEKYLTPNKDGLKVSIPTRFEVFGTGPENVNWGDAVRHEYFKKCTNRIKVGANDKDDTKYWWLSDPYPSTSTYFCSVNSGGGASLSIASVTDGGVSPAICIS
jgi:hypothetical protein